MAEDKKGQDQESRQGEQGKGGRRPVEIELSLGVIGGQPLPAAQSKARQAAPPGQLQPGVMAGGHLIPA